MEGRENYKLWGYADLVPADAEITFAADTQSIAKDDKEGIAAPAIQVVTEYAQLLSGDETNVTFEGDSLATSLSEQQESISESLGETGTASVNAEALDHGPMIMATEDGGAVTMGYFNYDVEIDRTSAGSTITVGDELAQWLTEERRFDIRCSGNAHIDVLRHGGVLHPAAGRWECPGDRDIEPRAHRGCRRRVHEPG